MELQSSQDSSLRSEMTPRSDCGDEASKNRKPSPPRGVRSNAGKKLGKLDSLLQQVVSDAMG
jgi:hypothetical protein